ncbi:DUF4426 domain-containing protein [Aliidiomarina quisquiliarum]|uniref:DUF4426 domain-containing protein n=1 Tax=Aliidiomarina quisquiliarum TaxID=2938947 RepID=UPI00208F4ED8|nr:DUF4426 domain-containing protein [Aliidiomarina quisquiliarum]MCO4321919.1 DUF4426 domain-containing protein [Aliidiomarina quisquiliarum]
MRSIILTLCFLAFAPYIIGQQAVAQQSSGLQDNSSQVQGGQFERLANWHVHYSAFASTFLQPEVAKAYNLVRSRAQGIVSISVLDAATQQSQRVAVSGYALNSLGQRRELSFRRISEGDSLYYLTSVSHENEDRYRFFINLRHGDISEELRFTHTFYRN